MDDHRLGLSMIISNTRDSYLGIFDQGNPQFVVSATDYPVQMVLLYHLDLGPGRFSESLEATLKRYDDAPGYFDLNGGCVAFTGGYIKGATKIFNLDSGIVCLDSFSLSGKLSDNSVAASFVCVGLGFLTSIKDFDSNSKCLPVLASMVAHYEIENLFFKSEYFRKVKLYQSLFPQAYEMQRKYDDDRANHKPYAFVEFQEDAKKLDQAVAQLGLSGKFAKNLLDEAGSYLTPGTLLYHFSDYWGFTIQWIILNVIAIVLLPLLRVILKIGKIVEGFIRRASPYVIVCSINLWAFNRRPDSLPFLYWIIPGLLFVAALLLAHWWFPDPKKKANI